MKTEIIAILDRSGSMSSCANEAIGGFNNFLNEQKLIPGEARMTLVLFDDQYERLYEGKHLVDAKMLTPDVYYARGMTALLDAIGRTLEEQGKRIAIDMWAEKVIVCIVTDGLENASKEYTDGRISGMIKHAESKGWSFIYLGANQDAFQVGATIGISPQFTQSYAGTAAGTQVAYANLSATASSLRTGSVTAVTSTVTPDKDSTASA